MISAGFKHKVEQNVGGALIVAGSHKDEPHIGKIIAELLLYEIPHEVRIASAHKQPGLVEQIVKEYDSLAGPFTYISVAGKVDALSGTLSFLTENPVISCPPDWPNYSCLGNPRGSANAVIPEPQNVAKFLAQSYRHMNHNYRRLLIQHRGTVLDKLEEEDRRLRKALGDHIVS